MKKKKRSPNKTINKYITRVKTTNVKGLNVRIPTPEVVNGKRKQHSKLFALDEMKKALQYRDQKGVEIWGEEIWLEMIRVAFIPSSKTEKTRLAMRKPKKNLKNGRGSTGLSGVHYCMARGIKYYVASYQVDTKQKRKQFSTKKYGEKEAFILACKVRFRKTGCLNVISHRKLIVPVREIYKQLDASDKLMKQYGLL